MKRWLIGLTALSLVATSLWSAEETKSPSYILVGDECKYSILNPTLQERKTAKILLDNGLEAYLISDPGIDQSSAGISVEAGSWQDPVEYPGMAHFLEHMLFMGNKAYPEEEEYFRYINDYAGGVNAFTAPDRTVYMFSVNHDGYEGALDRFSHFFIDPLFNPSCIHRELHAVDQEHAKNVENDAWREYMVLKETGNPNHPNAKFSTGNAATLSGIPQQALLSWYETHYSSDRMHLVMLSNLPIETMTRLATEKFSLVPKREMPSVLKEEESLLSKEQKGHFLYIRPIKDLKSLALTWELPASFGKIQQRATVQMVSYALEQASDKSLIEELKREGLAEDLFTESDTFQSSSMLFQIRIKLTEKGLSQMDTVILRCYQALARLKQTGLPLALFQERKTLNEIAYQYQSRQDPFSWASATARALVEEELASFPEQTMIPSNFNPESISQFLEALTPASCVYVVLADPEKIPVETNKVEKWMHVHYKVDPVPSSKLTSWEQAAAHPDILLPPSNPFIPSLKLASDATAPSSPELLFEEEKVKVYFAFDTDYQLPQVSLHFHLHSPIFNGSARSKALSYLLSKALLEGKLSSTLFFASEAGLSASLSPVDFTLHLSVEGYQDKAAALTEVLFNNLQSISISQEEFDRYKASLSSSFFNATKELPVRQALEAASSILKNEPTSLDLLNALQEITLPDFSSFCSSYLTQVYVEGMIYGNLTKEQSLLLCKNLQAALSSSKAYPPSEQKRPSVLLLPSNKGPYKVTKQTASQGNGVVLVLQQGPFSFEKKAAQQVLSVALQESFFDTLRTKQQTAYIARSWAVETEKQLSQFFAVQSSSNPTEELLVRFDIFLEDFDKRILDLLSKERFEQLKQSQLTLLQTPSETLFEKAALLDTYAFEKEADFHYLDKKIAAMKALSYEDLIQEAHECLSKQNSKRLAVLLQGSLGSSQKPLTYQVCDKEEVQQAGTFVSIK